MGATVLVSGLSAGFGVLLIAATGYLGAMLRADPYLGDSDDLAIVVTILSVLLIGIAMYVAAIVTANTFATIVAGRTRQIALMRLIGASARSERAKVAREGLGVGVIGAVVGLLVGTVIAVIAVPIMNRLLGHVGLDYSPLQPTLVLPAAAVALTTWCAAWAGSRRVLTVAPLQALSGAEARSAVEVRSRTRTVTAVALLVAGGLLLAAGVLAGLVSPGGVIIAFVGGVLSFTGLALGATFIMPPVLRLVGRLFGGSATARLAAGNALREPERSSRMAIGVVMGVTLVTMFAVAAESAKSVLTAASGGTPDPQLNAVLDGFSGVMMGLVGVSAVIAAVGLVNLLTIGVVQRRRELGLLRSLGFTSRQVRTMVLLEAAHVSIASLLTGLVLGVLYGWIGAQSSLGAVTVPPEYTSPTFVLPAVPWVVIVGVIVATVLLTLAAAVVPTRLATRITPVQALAAD
ncbi:ABC transporter permease [Microbacterium gorillae]|uniref:ABC transporter permease n=1 Tax=Microbacterium gorillae TaxID=1231063 RepID=UPI000B9C4CEB|nr:ABC transporter permease [Microbacterium gorillae]